MSDKKITATTSIRTTKAQKLKFFFFFEKKNHILGGKVCFVTEFEIYFVYDGTKMYTIH